MQLYSLRCNINLSLSFQMSKSNKFLKFLKSTIPFHWIRICEISNGEKWAAMPKPSDWQRPNEIDISGIFTGYSFKISVGLSGSIYVSWSACTQIQSVGWGIRTKRDWQVWRNFKTCYECHCACVSVVTEAVPSPQ